MVRFETYPKPKMSRLDPLWVWFSFFSLRNVTDASGVLCAVSSLAHKSLLFRLVSVVTGVVLATPGVPVIGIKYWTIFLAITNFGFVSWTM